MVNKKSFFFILIFIVFLFFIFQKTSFAQPVLFSDNFEDGNFNDWQEVQGSGIWKVNTIDGSYRLGAATSKNIIEVQAGDFLWSDYEFSVDVLPKLGFDRNLMFRVTNNRTNLWNLNLPIAYGLHMYDNHIWFQKFTSSEGLEPINLNVSLPINVSSKIIVRAQNNNFKIYINDLQHKVIDYTDTNDPILNGKIGLIITNGAATKTEVWFDNIVVSDIPSPPSLPSLNVPYLSQLNPVWATEVYDNSNKWSDNPYIYRWGCALTSASMVLNYYGFGTNPKTLNDWLKSQIDGYLDNGLVNWLALSRYSYLYKTDTIPALEYRRFGNNRADLIAELKSGSPSILKEQGHYIVAKSQLPSSFGINDPAFSDRVTLDSYQNTFLAMNSFHPTHTDLSYIMLTIDPKYIIRVFDDNGREILDHTFIEEGLVDDADASQNTSDSIRVFQVPIPREGVYKVDVSGESGQYELNFYAYDKDANVKKFIKSGVLLGNTQDSFNINFGGDPAIYKIVSFDKLINDLNSFYSQKQISTRIFHLLKTQVNIIKRLANNSRLKTANVHLRNLYFQIKMFTPKFISSSSSIVLLDDIKTLLNSI